MNATHAFDAALLAELARCHGTPLYVYDASTIRAQVERLRAASRSVADLGTGLRGFERIRFAQKANSCQAILRLLVDQGVALDAVSAGEIQRARAAGVPATEITFCADLFDPAALELIRTQALTVVAGSRDMLEQLARLRPAAKLWLRVNPGYGAGGHAKVTTGGEHSKHGIWHAELGAAVKQAKGLGLEVSGLHVHVGSGFGPADFQAAAMAVIEAARCVGPSLTSISAGGGLPVPYHDDEAEFDLLAHARTWSQARQQIEWELQRPVAMEVEPGRFLVAQAGVLLTTVHATKTQGREHYALVDAGFHSLVRPAMYGAFHRIEPLVRRQGPQRPTWIAGPLCESGDVLSTDGTRPAARLMPPLQMGDVLAVRDVGAYGASMASRYNSQPLPAEVLVDQGRVRLIRARETFEDLLRQERE